MRKPPTKIIRTLHALYRWSSQGKKISPWDLISESMIKDLSTYISDIKRIYGVTIHDMQDQAKDRYGVVNRFKRYWIDEDQMERVKQILDGNGLPV